MIVRCGHQAIPLLLLLVAGCGRPPVELVEPDLTKADPLVAELIRLSAQNVRDSGGSPASWAEYGRVCWSNAFVPEANDAFTKALDQAPDNARFLYARGLIARESYDLQSALQDVLRARDAQPDEIFLHWRAAWIAMEMGEFDQAATCVSSAQAIDPNDRNTLRVAARLELEQGDAERGLSILKPLVEGSAVDRDVLWLQARLLRAAGRGDEAASLAMMVGDQTPRYTDPWAAWAKGRKTGVAVQLDRALLLAKEQRHQEAEAVFKNLESLEIDQQHLDLLEARLQVAQGQSGLAAVSLARLVQAYPDWASPHHELAMLMIRPQKGRPRPPASDLERATTMLRRAVELNPDSHVARGGLVQALLINQQWAEAVEHARQCRDAAPLQQVYHTRLAGAQVASGDVNGGLQTLDQARSLFGGPELPATLIIRIRAYAANKDLAQASSSLAELKAKAPNHPAIPRMEALIRKASQ